MFYKLFKKEFKFNIYKPFINNLKKPFEFIFSLIIYFLIIASSIIIFVNLLKGFSNYHLSKEILILLISIFCLIEVFTSINKYRSVIFDVNDKSILLSLPIKSKDVILSKILVLLVKELCFSCLVILPIIISFLIVSKASSLLYVFAVFTVLMFSIIPLCLTMLIVFLIPKKRKLNIGLFLWKLLIYVIIFTLYYFVLKTLLHFVNNNSLSFIFTTQNAKILENIANFSFPFVFIGNILVGNQIILNLMFLIFVDLLLVFLVLFFAKKVFNKENFEEKNNPVSRNMFLSSKHPLLKKEIILLTRKEDFFYNYLFILISVPYLCYLQMMVINELIVETFGINYRLPFALMTIILITCIANILGINILKNENYNFNMMKIFPISLKKQIFTKLMLMLGLLLISNFSCLFILLLTKQIAFIEFIMYFIITLLFNSGLLIGAFNKTINTFKVDFTAITIIKAFIVSFFVLILSLVFNLVYDFSFIDICAILLLLSGLYFVYELFNFKRNLNNRLELLVL